MYPEDTATDIESLAGLVVVFILTLFGVFMVYRVVSLLIMCFQQLQTSFVVWMTFSSLEKGGEGEEGGEGRREEGGGGRIVTIFDDNKE